MAKITGGPIEDISFLVLLVADSLDMGCIECTEYSIYRVYRVYRVEVLCRAERIEAILGDYVG